LFIERPYATALHSALHYLLRGDAFPVEIAGKSNLHYRAIASLPLTFHCDRQTAVDPESALQQAIAIGCCQMTSNSEI